MHMYIPKYGQYLALDFLVIMKYRYNIFLFKIRSNESQYGHRVTVV